MNDDDADARPLDANELRAIRVLIRTGIPGWASAPPCCQEASMGYPCVLAYGHSGKHLASDGCKFEIISKGL